MIFRQFLLSAVNNAHVLYKHYYKLERNNSDYAFIDFVMLLVKEMCGADSKNKQKEAAASPPMCFPAFAKRDSKNQIDREDGVLSAKKPRAWSNAVPASFFYV